MVKRMVIPINFTDENDYEYVKNQPNASHYIRELVKKDRENVENTMEYVDKKIEELKKELKNVTFIDSEADNKSNVPEISKETVNNFMKMFN